MSTAAIVIGTVFIDCKGFARDAYLPTGRNLGSVQFVHGGVGRNVAENVARLGVPTQFVSSVDGGLGQEVLERLEQTGADVSSVVRAEHRGMGMWLAVLDHKGDLAGSISQMPDLTGLEQAIVEQGEQLIRSASHLLLEIDLTPEIARTVLDLAARYNKPVYGLPGNLEIVLGYPELMGKLACFVCNHIEAEQLLGLPLHELDDERRRTAMFDYLRASGLASIVVTFGDQGALYADSADGSYGHQPVFPVVVKDTSGAGDGFFSGVCMGLIRGLSLKDAVVCGTKVAGWTIESPENNCPDADERLRRDDTLQALLRQKQS